MIQYKQNQKVRILDPNRVLFSENVSENKKQAFKVEWSKLDWVIISGYESDDVCVLYASERGLYISIPIQDIIAKKTIYISGPITDHVNGGKIEGHEKLFEMYETKMLAHGYDVVNPIKLFHNHDQSWESFLRVDLTELLLRCDEIGLMRDKEWKRSEGCKIELFVAWKLKMPIIDLNTLKPIKLEFGLTHRENE